MKFADICFITDDVLRLSAFYESILGGKAEGDESHATMNMDGIGLTFLSQKNPAFYYDLTNNAGNVILSFNVDDVDFQYNRLLSLGVEMVNEPTTHPWGARSFQFKDPDGNIINFRSIPKGN